MYYFFFNMVFFWGFSVLIFMAGSLLNKKKLGTMAQGSPFECGVNSLEFSELPMSVRFFMLSVVFLIFDVELVLLMPFLIYVFSGLYLYSSFVFISIMLVLLLGVFLEWNNYLLEWV